MEAKGTVNSLCHTIANIRKISQQIREICPKQIRETCQQIRHCLWMNPCLEVVLEDDDELIISHEHKRTPNGAEHVREVTLKYFH